MPSVVVSDTSPIRALHHLGRLDLIRTLYGSALIPPAVRDELLRPSRTSPAIELSSYPWLIVRATQSSPADLGVPPDLDPGETEAITLAIESRADLLLVDERKATSAALQLGLNTVGVLGVLLESKRAGLIPSVLPHVDRLIAGLDFFVSPVLRAQIATLAKE
jgi:predicted nucleic acid-binding protein